MKSNIYNVLEIQLQFNKEIGYFVPEQWWNQFCQLNQKVQSKQQLVFPSLNLQKYVDPFLLEFEESIVAELQHKSNYLKFNKVVLSPQLKKDMPWTIISSKMWKIINNKVKSKFGILTTYNQNNPYEILTSNQLQIQIIFCSKNKSAAFVGFLPQSTYAVNAIRGIGYQLGFVEFNSSRLMFPDKSTSEQFYFCQLQGQTLLEAQDTLYCAYNMENIETQGEKDDLQVSFSFKKNEQFANSNEANAGDFGNIGLESFQQIRNDGTISTGAQTPSFFASEREFRVRQLFRQKSPEQISELREKAKKIIIGKLIGATIETNQEKIKQDLQTIAHELVEHIQSHKKKVYKDKQIHQE